MKTIYWFSGSGNSLYAARFIAERLGGEKEVRLIRITRELIEASPETEGDCIGFVFPSYSFQAPDMVVDFVRKLKINGNPYIFSVVTMGRLTAGLGRIFAGEFRKKNCILSYCAYVKMPANAVFLYNPETMENIEEINDELESAAIDIKGRDKFIDGGRITVPVSLLAKKCFRKIQEKNKASFRTLGSCTGCGTCASVCPEGNISIQAGKPVWGARCQMCMACVHWCPEKAAQCGSSENRGRYTHPLVKAADISGH